MGADFTAELANGVGHVDNKLTGMANSAREAKKAGADMGDQFDRAFKLAGRGVKEAAEEMEGMGHQIYEVGHALRSAGGPLGEFAHKFTGGLRMGGPLAGIAVAAGIASVGLEIYNKIAERHVEQVKLQVEANEKLSDSLYEVDRKSKESAQSAAESNAADERKMASRGGREAEHIVDRITDSYQGIDRKDARAAVTKSYDIKSEIRSAAVRAAEAVAASGEMTMTEAMDTIAGSPAIQARLHRKKDENQANIGPAAQRIILEARHLPPTRENLFQAQQQLGANTDKGDETGVFAATNRITANRNRIEMRDRKDLTSGKAVTESDRSTSRALDPLQAKMDDWMVATEKAAAANRAVADAQTEFSRWMANNMHVFGGKGSLQMQGSQAETRDANTRMQGEKEAREYRDSDIPKVPGSTQGAPFGSGESSW